MRSYVALGGRERLTISSSREDPTQARQIELNLTSTCQETDSESVDIPLNLGHLRGGLSVEEVNSRFWRRRGFLQPDDGDVILKILGPRSRKVGG